MTIKEFADLCGCNPQTLRYYDHVDLLKPVKVDQWSGYRYYEKEQALVFVKIRNLQRAGFTIAEIRKLLKQDDAAVYEAFESKIAEAEQRLQEIRIIRQSYQTEMKKMNDQLDMIRASVAEAMRQYDPMEEFGIDRNTYETVRRHIGDLFGGIRKEQTDYHIDFQDGSGHDEHYLIDFRDEAEKKDDDEEKALSLLRCDPSSVLVCERHDWQHVREFFEEFSVLEDGGDYSLLFALEKEKKQESLAFANIVLTLLVMKNENRKINLSCSVKRSRDGKNHFWMFRKAGN